METTTIDVNTSANVAPTEPQKPSSFAEEYQSWTPEQRKDWDVNEKEPEKPTAAAPAEPVIDKAPAPEKAKVEPEAGSGEADQDQEPDYYGTPEQIKKQKHAFAAVKRRAISAETEARVLREQRAEKPAVTAAAPKAEAKPESKLERPRRPKVSDFNDPIAFDKANEEFDDKLDAYIEARLDGKFQDYGRTQEVHLTRRQQAQQWQDEVRAGREAHADFDTMTSRSDVVVSLPMIGVCMSVKGGGEALYHLASNPELAAALTAETDIAGDFKNYAELAEAAEKNPALARQLGAAEALVKAEIKRFKSGAPKADPNPKPITASKAPPPAARVDSSTSGPAKDALAEAYAQYDKTGEHKYLELANKLEDEKEQAERVARRRKT